MKDLIVQKQLERIRTNETKQTFEIGQTINFKWWDLYGSGKAIRKIIDKTPKRKTSRKIPVGEMGNRMERDFKYI